MRIVIARTDAIGDTLLTAPLAEAIKFKYPQAEILFIVSSKGLPVVENNPFIDQIHLYDPRTKWASFRALYDKLKSFHADYFFYVGGDHMCSFAAFLARIPCRGGILSRWPSFLFLNRGLRQHRCQSDKHEVFYNLDLLFPLKITGDDSKKNLFVGMYLEPEKEKNAVDEFKKQLSSLGLPAQREWIFVHPGMAGHTLNWPSHFYGQLIRELEKKIPERFLFVVSHTPVDAPYVAGLRQGLAQEGSFSGALYFFDGSQKGLRFFASIVKQAALFVGPSTGTTHIANGFDVPLVALYSPLSVQGVVRWGPWRGETKKQVRAYTPSKEASGLKNPMETIMVAEILKSAVELLSNSF